MTVTRLASRIAAQADATIVSVAIPAIRTDLGASGAVAGLVVGGYRLVSPPSTAYWLAVTDDESRWERSATGSFLAACLLPAV